MSTRKDIQEVKEGLGDAVQSDGPRSTAVSSEDGRTPPPIAIATLGRVIKFRVWDATNAIMMHAPEGYMFPGDTLGGDHEGVKLSVFKRRDLVPLQFTGLQDKNGKDIYEGDIADYTWTGGLGDEFVLRGQFVYVLAPCGGAFGFKDIGERSETGRILKPNTKGVFNVIGNIHENPELLSSNS